MTAREKNELAFSKRFRENYFEIYKNLQANETEKCCVEVCENGEKIISYLRNGRKWRLNSIYDPVSAAKLYAERFEKIQDYAFVCICGFSDGRVVRELLTKCNGTQTILVYEPEVEIFLASMREFELEDLFYNRKVYMVIEGINTEDHDTFLAHFTTYQNRELMVHCILPNYDILYEEKCRNQIEKMLYHSKSEGFKRNTEVLYSGRLADNILENMPYLLTQSSLRNLKQAFLKLNLEGVPAIIVSAGPSLDKNIKELKNAEGKAFIIGVDSALKALVREGIHFQMAISIDPRKDENVFADERVNEYPYVLSSYSIPMISKKNKKKLFFKAGYGFGTFKNIFKEATGKELEDLKTGGSVATDALSMAIDFGFRNVILVGQDLAFTGGKGHVSGFEKSDKADKEHVAGRRLTEVEAIDGGKVLTDIQMDSYRQWFETRIEGQKDRMNFFNATEGGAKIKGTTALSLKEAIERFCVREVAFDRIIAEVPPTFTEEEQDRILEKLVSAPEYLMDLERKIQLGIEAYEEFIKLEKNSMQQSPEYREILKQTARVNKLVDEESYMSIVKLYSKKAEYGATDDIYASTELTPEEIAERAIWLLKGYKEGCGVCRRKMESIMIPRLQEAFWKNGRE